MTYRYTFTVFTPTYNRAHTLHRVYDSLKKQTFRDFEWVIIDDGSTDNTRKLIESWQKETDFPINYIWQENQGKHIAFNRGVQEACGDLLLPLDSDDSCVSTALERFKYHWDSIPENNRPKFSAVSVLCIDQYGNLIGDKFPGDTFDSDSLEMKYKYKIRGEKWGFHRTEILKNFPFPEIKGQKFIPEGIVWSAIAAKYRTRFVNEPLRIYWTDESGQSDQLTKSAAAAKKHAAGHALWHQSILNNEIGWFLYAPGQFLRSAVHYARFSFHSKTGALIQLKKLNNSFAKALWVIALVVGYLVYLNDEK